MNLADRRAALALQGAERPDMIALRSALDRVSQNFDDILALQEEEIFRLRRFILLIVEAYRLMQSISWRGGTNNAKFKRFTAAMDAVCLEADAIRFAEDLPPKKRPVPKRG